MLTEPRTGEERPGAGFQGVYPPSAHFEAEADRVEDAEPEVEGIRNLRSSKF